MKKYALAVSILVCTVMLGVALAQEKQAEPKPEQTPKATTPQMGQVVSIDPAKNEIVIKDDSGAEVHLLIATSTKITREGKSISLNDVKVGDKIASECQQSADGCKAKSVAVMPPPQQ